MLSAGRDAAAGRAISQQGPGRATGLPHQRTGRLSAGHGSLGVRSDGEVAGYEPIHIIRKAKRPEVCWVQKVGLLHRFILGLFAAT
jgi:hypothetical protein